MADGATKRPARKEREVKTTALRVGTGAAASRQTAITAPTGGATVDAEARTAINAIITRLEAFGLVTEN